MTMMKDETSRETHLRKGRQTVRLGLLKVIHDLFPEEKLKTSYSILEGVFCNLYGSVLSVREVRLISEKLHEWASKDNPIEFIEKKNGYFYYQVGDIIVQAIYPAYTSTSEIEPFNIIPFSYGFIVDFEDPETRSGKAHVSPYLLSQTFQKYQHWLDNIDIEVISDINYFIDAGHSQEVLRISEALHEKEISDIADKILHERRSLRVLLVSGPSSSGKTSFAQRLSTQLKVNGLKPVDLSLDDYYVDRVKTPLDEEGNFDFECLEALDLELLHEHIAKLANGEQVESPLFDFSTGTRKKETKTLKVGQQEILLIEGIHALNPDLLGDINRSSVFKIYVSALGGVNIDLISRIPTTEIRLIRRMVRDDRTRGLEPEETLKHWANVRKGEYRYIFAFQEEADVMFNSSLLYELNVLRPHAEKCLAKIKDDSIYYETKERLLNLLTFFKPMEDVKVPFNSIIREFIGDSIYFGK
ncbi:uridine kinase family protein [Parasporobacterium paucivorans]|uniref:Uridine kinase n=1 Tax=Parasporobacterium paucivorans DSM 15970 TaxID=1122934 RepID=A0A1M6DQA6_9FIRM|nr:nucleoside kinase [Parasporobacterium paucivorans]SHI75417.1 uridine kinase [Parasporobacterium paucivorans DSM 15970]